MRKIFIFIAIAITMTNCYLYTGVYKIGLQEVESPKNIKEQFGETKVVNFQDNGVTKYSYEDGFIKIVWLPQDTHFSFKLTNKSEHSIKIIWDEAVYVNESGLSQKVFHSGVKYIDRNNSLPPSTIIKGAYVEDIVIPTDNVYFTNGQYGGWKELPLFKNSSSKEEQINAFKELYVGKIVKILLPIRIEDVNNEYLFSFKIEDMVITKTEL
jgi:hypothetical protein